MAAPVLLPVLVEVKEPVEPAVEVQAGVPVEIRVHLQVAAGPDLVKAATCEVGVGNQALDTGEALEEVDEHLTVELGKEVAGGRPEALEVRKSQLDLLGVVELLPFGIAGLGELGEH